MSTRYVWSKWNVTSESGTRYVLKYQTASSSETEDLSGYYGSIETTATASANGVSVSTPIYASDYNYGETVKGYITFTNSDKVYYGEFTAYSSLGWEANTDTFQEVTSASETYTNYSKGTTSYGNVSSSSYSYPTSGKSGSYWYVYSGSDSIDPSSVTYNKTYIQGGNTLKVTISPSTSKTQDGTVKYTIQYSLDGTNWKTAVSNTTSTSYTITVPSTATSFQAKVTASDNLGFTSTSAVSGTKISVYDLTPQSVTFDEADVISEANVPVTITAASTDYSGAITYSIEVNTDSAGYEESLTTEGMTASVPVTKNSTTWAVRVRALDSNGDYSGYVYGNGSEDPVTVQYDTGFSVYPKNKNLGYIADTNLLSVSVGTADSSNYTCTISLDGTFIYSGTTAVGVKTVTVTESQWAALSEDSIHTIVFTATNSGKSITRTYTFKKFSYEYDTLPHLFKGIRDAICIKRGKQKGIYGYDLAPEILDITEYADVAIDATINVTATYPSGAGTATALATSESGNVYSATIASDGTASINVSESGNYTVRAKIGDVYSSSADVSLSEDGNEGSAAVSFAWVVASTVSGSTLKITNSSSTVYSGTIGSTGKVTVLLPALEKYTLTFSNTNYPDEDVTQTLTVSSYKEYTASATFVSSTLENNTWAVISSVAKSGKAASYWAVGDGKTVAVSGTVNGTSLSVSNIKAFILGFDHNSSYEGTNKIHFCLGKIDSNLIAFYDSSNFYMNTSSSNTGGWKSSYMRQTILSQFKECLPTELTNVLSTVTKYTDNTGSVDGSSSTDITATTDTLFLMGQYEVFNTATTVYANTAESNYQVQYDYFKNGNHKIPYQHNATSTATASFLRSPSNGSSSFVCMTTYESFGNREASNSAGFSPCFTI